MIELGILGPLVLTIDDEEVGLGPVLAMLTLALLCARGALVPIARLGGLLAAADGNPVAAVTVRSHVSHLRKAFGDSPGHGRGRRAPAIRTRRPRPPRRLMRSRRHPRLRR
jgi:DNA-binding SARP family transcriptional activator